MLRAVDLATELARLVFMDGRTPSLKSRGARGHDVSYSLSSSTARRGDPSTTSRETAS